MNKLFFWLVFNCIIGSMVIGLLSSLSTPKQQLNRVNQLDALEQQILGN